MLYKSSEWLLLCCAHQPRVVALYARVLVLLWRSCCFVWFVMLGLLLRWWSCGVGSRESSGAFVLPVLLCLVLGWLSGLLGASSSR
jgi:hypothetical protein